MEPNIACDFWKWEDELGNHAAARVAAHGFNNAELLLHLRVLIVLLGIMVLWVVFKH